MSRALHRQFMETVDLLEEAVSQLGKIGENQITLLTNMQELVLALGNRVEKIKSEQTQTIPLLEKLCEEIYALSNGETVDLYQTINKVRETIAKEFPDKVEMVFMPYKAAMWDSLESIWIAAEADAECEAHVVPMAYYDYDEEGNYKEKHYEGDLFPENVKVESYVDFDLEAHHPDVIFVHNPYDSYNRVTTVDPNFYSAEFKKYAEKVVYVPYYATSGALGENWRYLPSYLNFDYIVLQSEEYMDYINPIVPREKLLPLGSPKFDSAIRKCRNYNNKNEKKTYFYNTSLGGMLNNTEAFLDKLEYVLGTFKKHPEVQLLWRPHPLLESTFQSMRPEYYPRFKVIKESYLEENYGIYDTTPDMEASIAKCDAYVGDAATSVTAIFGVTGKPLFILNNWINELPDEKDIEWMADALPFVSDDGTVYDKYRVMLGNRLFKKNEKTSKYEYLCDVEYEGEVKYHNVAVDWKDKIYIFPTEANVIKVYDMKNKVMHDVIIRINAGTVTKFINIKIWKNKVILIPMDARDLLIFDMDLEEVSYVDNFSNFNIFVDVTNEKIPCANWICDGLFYALNASGTQMIVVDLETYEMKKTLVSIQRAMIHGAVNYNTKEVWLSPIQGTIVGCFSLLSKHYKEYDIQVDGLKSINRRDLQIFDKKIFCNPIFLKNTVVFSPMFGSAFVELNPKTGHAALWNCPIKGYKPVLEDLSSYRRALLVGFALPLNQKENTYLLYDGKSRVGYKYCANENIIENVVFENETNAEDIVEHENGFRDYSKWIRYCAMESATNTLEDFIMGINKGDCFDEKIQVDAYSKINASPEGNCGEKIVSFLIKSIKRDDI